MSRKKKQAGSRSYIRTVPTYVRSIQSGIRQTSRASPAFQLSRAKGEEPRSRALWLGKVYSNRAREGYGKREPALLFILFRLFSRASLSLSCSRSRLNQRNEIAFEAPVTRIIRKRQSNDNNSYFDEAVSSFYVKIFSMQMNSARM